MGRSEIEQVLLHWIDQAISPSTALREGTDRTAWIADNFIAWWRTQVDDSLSFADLSARRVRDELMQLRSPNELGEALHELTHVQDALADLRDELGLASESARDS